MANRTKQAEAPSNFPEPPIAGAEDIAPELTAADLTAPKEAYHQPITASEGNPASAKTPMKSGKIVAETTIDGLLGHGAVLTHYA